MIDGMTGLSHSRGSPIGHDDSIAQVKWLPTVAVEYGVPCLRSVNVTNKESAPSCQKLFSREDSTVDVTDTTLLIGSLKSVRPLRGVVSKGLVRDPTPELSSDLSGEQPSRKEIRHGSHDGSLPPHLSVECCPRVDASVYISVVHETRSQPPKKPNNTSLHQSRSHLVLTSACQ